MSVQHFASPVARPVQGISGLFEFSKYFATSGTALAVDAGVLALASKLSVPYPAGAAIGFVAGLLVAYILSTRWVFEARTVASGWAEFTVFATIGVAGLGLTELILWGAIGGLGWRLPVAKLCAAGIVFLFNFGARKVLLFRRISR